MSINDFSIQEINGNNAIKDDFENLNTNDNNLYNATSNHINGVGDRHKSSEIDNDSSVVGNNVKEALETVKEIVDNITVGASNTEIGVFSVNGSGTNTITANYGGITSYFGGLKVNLTIQNNNTGAVTFNLNGLGAKSIKKYDYQGVKQDLVIDDLIVNTVVQLQYDGTDFIAINKEPQVVNKNLLINSNFKVSELVNQRGEIIYTAQGHTFDMWYLRNPDGINNIVDLSSDYVTLTKQIEQFCYLRQYIEDSKKYENKKVTFSVEFEATAGTVIALRTAGSIVTGTFISTIATGEKEKLSLKTTIGSEGELSRVEIWIDSPTGNITLFNAKLEVGDVETKFIDDSLGNKLDKCQRYLQLIRGNSVLGTGTVRSTTTTNTAIMNYKLNKPMRVDTPTIGFNFTNTVIVKYGGNTNILSNVSLIVSKAKNGYVNFYLSANSTTSLLINDTVIINMLDTNDFILLSAEL